MCAAHLPLGPRPVVRARPSARLLIISQAPGTRVHETGPSFNDRRGDRLRCWRITRWLRDKPWFASEVLPELRSRVAAVAQSVAASMRSMSSSLKPK